jgi:hypothetical protein
VLCHSQSVITLRTTSWKISEAEDIPKLRRLYRNKPAVSPVVTLSKKNSDEIRRCVDMRNTNKAITHERHIYTNN